MKVKRIGGDDEDDDEEDDEAGFVRGGDGRPLIMTVIMYLVGKSSPSNMW